MDNHDDNVYYKMSDGRLVFCVHDALCKLMDDGIICAIPGKAVTNYDGDEQQVVVLVANCNDVFSYASCDWEEFAYDEIESLYLAWKGETLTRWICKHRGMQPQPSIRRRMIDLGMWDAEMEALPKNPSSAGA